MMYVKMLTTDISSHSSASDPHTMYCGNRVEFLEALDGPTMMLDGERHHVTGDCWVMNESGKTISQYAVPSQYLRHTDMPAQTQDMVEACCATSGANHRHG